MHLATWMMATTSPKPFICIPSASWSQLDLSTRQKRAEIGKSLWLQERSTNINIYAQHDTKGRKGHIKISPKMNTGTDSPSCEM